MWIGVILTCIAIGRVGDGEGEEVVGEGLHEFDAVGVVDL